MLYSEQLGYDSILINKIKTSFNEWIILAQHILFNLMVTV